MTTLANRRPKDTFGELLKLNNVGGLDTTLRTVEDGDGTASPLKLSTLTVAINGISWPLNTGAPGQGMVISADGVNLEWTSIVGMTGPTGATGPKGDAGATGATGPAGSTATAIDASAITGTTLAANVVTSSLTSVGTLASLSVTSSYTPLVYGAWSTANTVTGATVSGLVATTGPDQSNKIYATPGKSSGKWYWEVTITAGPSPNPGVGIIDSGSLTTANLPHLFIGAVGDVLGVAMDLLNKQVTIYKAGASVYTSSIATGTWHPAVSTQSSTGATFTANFGASAFAMTVPAGFTSGYIASGGGTGGVTGIIQTANQPAITSVGALTNLTVSGAAAIENIMMAGTQLTIDNPSTGTVVQLGHAGTIGQIFGATTTGSTVPGLMSLAGGYASGTANGGGTSLFGGNTAVGVGGTATVKAGDSNGGSGAGGAVMITAGITQGTGGGGAIIFNTGATTLVSERFRIRNDGAWSLGNTATNVGTVGQVLQSNGGGSSPSWTTISSGSGTGTVTSVSVASANGITGSVATATTTPAITLTLGNITPNYVTTTGENITAAVNTYRSLFFSTSGVANGGRWIMGADNASETAPSAGANFFMTRQDNSGVQAVVLTASRATGVVDFKAAPTVNGSAILTASAGIGASTLTGTTLATNVIISSLSTLYAASTTFKTTAEAAGTVILGGNSGPGGLIRGFDLGTAPGTITVRPGDISFSGTTGGALALTGGANISVGAGANGGPVNITGGAGAGGNGGNVTLAGAAGSTSGNGGNATVIGGTATGANTGGNVSIGGGQAASVANAGAIRFVTGATGAYLERFRVTGTGALAFGNNATNVGAAGQVLTSAGDAPPVWTTVKTIPYDVAGAVLSKPEANAYVMRFLSPRIFSIPAGMTGSVASTSTSSTASYVLSVQKNGVAFGTITFAAGAATGTFAAASATSIVSGDILTVQAPATADTTFNNAQFTLVGVL